jgi:hypothetical protein
MNDPDFRNGLDRGLSRCNPPETAPQHSLQSLTPPKFLSICGGVDTWPNGWAALRCPLTGTHVSDPSPKIDQPTTAPISRCLDLTCTVRRGYLCKRQRGSRLTGKKRALAPFNRPAVAMTPSTPGAGRAFWATTAPQVGCAALPSWRSRLCRSSCYGPRHGSPSTLAMPGLHCLSPYRLPAFSYACS